MKLDGAYYSLKKTEYDTNLQKCVEETCQFCIDNSTAPDEEKINHPLMMLGKIQSGKTRAFTGLIALAFDNDFDIVFILTKNSKALVSQTVSRMKMEFSDFVKGREMVVSDVMKRNRKISGYALEQKNIIVAKKQKQNIDKIIEFIEEYSISEEKRCLIIDDEADTTGIGYARISGTDEYSLRTVSAKVNELRGSLNGCVFVEVTATPYALYLQPEFDEESDLHPVKPKKTVLVPHGDQYVGGEYYFIESQEENHPANFLYTAMSDDEGELVSDQKRKGKKSKIDDRRSFKVENILVDTTKLPTFKFGLVNFILGSIILRTLQGNKECYSYVIHTAQQKNSHFTLEQIAETFLEQISNRNANTLPIIQQLIQESYSDLKASVEAYGQTMPSIDLLTEKFFEYVDKKWYSIDVVNADKDVDTLLDDDTGELYLQTPCSIFVGGQVLDRGVTISNLIGFYYGRNPVTMQQDTVLQHSRMFGYRRQLLPVTRFYTTQRIHSNMVKITEIDLALRDDIASGKQGDGVYFITSREQDDRFGKGHIVPCSPSKISISDVILITPHKRLLPVGFSPVCKTDFGKATNKIESILGKKDVSFTVELPKNKVEELLDFVYQTIVEDRESTRFISPEEMVTSIRYMLGGHSSMHVVVKREKKNTKFRKTGRYEDAPDNGQQERNEAKKLAVDKPVLILLEEDGNDDSWNFRSFWWPILVAPENVPKTMYASKVADKVVKND